MSMKRLQKFVSADELDPNSVDRTSNLGPAVSIEDGVFAWDNDGEPTLRELVVFLFSCIQLRFCFNLLLLVLVSTSMYREVHLWLLLVKWEVANRLCCQVYLEVCRREVAQSMSRYEACEIALSLSS